MITLSRTDSNFEAIFKMTGHRNELINCCNCSSFSANPNIRKARSKCST